MRCLNQMRCLYVSASAILALGSVPGAFAQTAPRAAPTITETQDAGKKAEYLESFPYRPCPANVRFPNGQQMCLGLPGHPFFRPYVPNE
jgi:hypothetical protein